MTCKMTARRMLTLGATVTLLALASPLARAMSDGGSGGGGGRGGGTDAGYGTGAAAGAGADASVWPGAGVVSTRPSAGASTRSGVGAGGVNALAVPFRDRR
jgi:hypothetical protein